MIPLSAQLKLDKTLLETKTLVSNVPKNNNRQLAFCLRFILMNSQNTLN